MALKTVLETTDGLDEAISALYTEQGGKFILDIDGVDEHPDVANLRNAYARTKEGQSAAKTEAAALKAKIAELEAGAPDTAATQAKLSQLEERLAAAEAAAGEWQGKYTGITRDQTLYGALQEAGIIKPAFIKAASALLKDGVKVAEDGSAYVETSMGPKMLGDYVKSWVASEGAAFVEPAKGGGAKEGDGGGKPNNSPLAKIPGFADLPEK
jgi:hypothetical protein